MKKSFSLFEIIVVISLIAIITVLTIPKIEVSKLNQATEKVILYLHYTRYIALLDNKYDVNNLEWEKKRWTMKFQQCSKGEDGLYFVVYSDMSGGTAHFKKKETMLDPLNNKYLYSGYDCVPNADESSDILLTKEYGIKDIIISCNTTSTIGQISFGHDGKIYSQLGINIKEVEETCGIKLIDKLGNSNTILLEPKTGYIHKL